VTDGKSVMLALFKFSVLISFST